MSAFELLAVQRYMNWLTSYTQAGGKITHVYDYPYQRAGFLLALRDFRTGGECGSAARPILIPAGVQHLGGGLGHNNLYFEQDGSEAPQVLGRRVPAYSDAEFATVPGYVQAKAVADAEKAASDLQMRRFEQDAHARAQRSDLSRYLGRAGY